MTAKRNLKRRVRERQVRTGERYTAARRRLLAEHSGAARVSEEAPLSEAVSASVTEAASVSEAAPVTEAASVSAAEAASVTEAVSVSEAASVSEVEPVSAAIASPMSGSDAGSLVPVSDARSSVLVSDGAPGVVRVSSTSSSAVPVFELLDVSGEAARLGFRCRVALLPPLATRVEPVGVLTALHNALAGTVGDPSTALLSSVALSGQSPSRHTRVRDFEAERPFFRRALAGIGGTTDDGRMLALQVAGRDGTVPVLCTLSRHDRLLVLMALDVPELELRHHLVWIGAYFRFLQEPEPRLFLIYDGRRYPVSTADFVIGHSRATADLAIRDGLVSRKHAAVIHRNGTYYLKDLGSAYGIHYKGMRIDNKRIDEGDVFQIGDHEVRFTYQPEV